MVAPDQEHHGGVPDPPSTGLRTPDDRLVPDRLGSSLGQQVSCLRGLVPRPEGQPHQLVRAESDPASSSEVGATFLCSASDDTLRQQHCGGLPKQGGGDSGPDPMLPNLGNPAMVSGTQDNSTLLPYTREEESHSRHVESEGPSISHRVDSESPGDQGHIPNVGTAPHRFICDKSKQSIANLCISSTRLPGMGGRRASHRLDRPGSVCISSRLIDTKGTPQTDPLSVHDSNCTPLDQQSLVSNSDGSEARGPVHTPPPGGPTSTTPQQLDTPRPCAASVSCMEAVKSRLLKEGFSVEAASRVAASRRPSTQRSYNSKLRVYQSWAKGRGLDPFTASRLR